MSSRAPLHRYETIAQAIRETIERGAHGANGRLPSERWFGQSFRAQRNTVRQALGLLESEGLIASVGKSGWFVVPRELLPTAPPLAGSRVMLVAFRRPTGSTMDRLAAGLREALDARGVGLLRYDSPSHDEAAHIGSVEELTTVDAAGIVMWPESSVDRSLLARLQTSTPLVLVDRRVFGFESDSVVFDDARAGREITAHLVGLGHRRIAFLGDEPFVESVQARWRGYRRALEDAGIVYDESLTVFTFGTRAPLFRETVRLTLERKGAPTAVVCSNDGVASALILALRELGRRVPEDLVVTGFGNDASAYLDVMGLTTMAQPFERLGRAAGELLLRRLGEPLATRGAGYEEIPIPMSLVPRASTGEAPAGERA